MRYNINNNNLSEVFYSIERQLEKQENEIKELLKLDYKYSKMKIDLKEFKNILHQLENETLDISNKEQKVVIKYNGNPYITLNLSVLALLTRTIIKLDCNQCMYGTNSIIVKTINNVLADFCTDKLIDLEYESITEENIGKIIIIDDINQYNLYKLHKNINAKFYCHNYIDFYEEGYEFEDIAELIYQYGENNQIHIESYSELEAEKALNMILKNGLGKAIVILSTNDKTKQLFQNNIKGKKIYINKNPFEKEFEIINKEVLYIE